MLGQYIPDLTERFPEGFDGVDLTGSYFPCEGEYDYDEHYWDSLEEEHRCNERDFDYEISDWKSEMEVEY